MLGTGIKRVQFQIQNPFIYDDNAWQPPIFSTFYLKNPKSNPPLFAHTKKAQRQLFLWYKMHLPLNYDRCVNSLYRYCLIINNKTLDTLYSDFGCRKKEQSGFSYQNEEKTGKVTLRLTLIKRYVNEKIIDYLCHLKKKGKALVKSFSEIFVYLHHQFYFKKAPEIS